MLGKKLLSFVALLFVGHIAKVSAAAALGNCSGIESHSASNSGECTPAYYCLNVNKITAVGQTGGNADCKYDLDAGVHVFEVTNAASDVKELPLGGSVSTPTVGNLAMYTCNASKCAQTGGYAIFSNGKYSIDATGGGSETTGTYVESCTFANVGKLKEIPAVTGRKRAGETYELCINEGKSVAFSPGNYIMLGTGAASTPFASANKIVITADTNSIIKNTVYGGDAKGVYCVYGDNSIMDRKTNFCSGTILNKLYVCQENGSCTEQPADMTAGDYLLVGNEQLYTFTISSGNLVIAEPTTNGVFAFAKNDATDVTYSKAISDFTTITDADLAKILVYNCKNGRCTAIPGYIKYGPTNSELLASCSASLCQKDTGAKSCSETGTDEGSVQLDGSEPKNLQLCIATSSFTTPTSDTYYVKKGTAYTAYTYTTNVIGQVPIEGHYLVAADHKLATSSSTTSTNELIYCSAGCEAVEDPTGKFVNAPDGQLISCTDDSNHYCSIGTSIDVGYYVNAGANANTKPYIKCGTTCELLVKSDLDLITSCTADLIGQIIKDGVLCLNGEDTAKGKKDFTNTGDWLVSYHANSVFASLVNSSGKFGVVTITANSMTIKDVDVAICADDTTLAVTNKSGSCSGGTAYNSCTDGICELAAVCNPTVSPATNCEATTYYLLPSNKLYYCSTAIACEEIIKKGYYINFSGNDIDKVYTCDGSSASCSDVTSTKLAAGSCDEGGKTGKIFKSDDGEASICIHSGTSIKLEDVEGNVMKEYHANNIFGVASDHSAVVKITENSIALQSDYTQGSLKYVYVQKSDGKVLVRGDTAGNTAACSNAASNIDEYDCNNGICTKN